MPDWTLDDLVARVDAALAAPDYPGAPNGRVRDVPDRRAIRWYTTIGLLDRPAGMRGRTALYGPRHLAQLVAIKRRQAEGRTLAEIQAELVGATDATLRGIAALPGDPEAAAPLVEAAAAPPHEPPHEPPQVPPARTRAFWAEPPGPPAPVVRIAAEPVLTGVPLDGGAVLLLPAAPDPADLPALRAAARPLLDLLTARGLLATLPEGDKK